MEKNFYQSKKRPIKSRYDGFTLLECLFALFILSTICLLFTAVVKNVAVVTKQLENETDKAWQIFLIQLENELKNCQYESTQENKIILKNNKNGKVVWVEFKLGKIVKVENGGYQPLLTKVADAKFIQENNSVKISVTFENQLTTEAKWIITPELKHEI